MNKRIRAVRVNAGLSQESFAKRIGLTKNYVSLVETGDRNPSDRTILDICREFNVNEQWLRTGEGDMMQELSRKEMLSMYASQVINGDDNFQKALVEFICTRSPEEIAVIRKQIEDLAKLMD